jgi:carnitine O-acetyltransferase
MGYRDSVVVNVSYYYGFSRVPKHEGQSPAVVAADLTHSALLFRKKLLNGEVAPEGTKEGPWCMDSWRYMFDACRIPGAEGLDWVTSYVKTTDTGDHGHVVVIRKGRFWKVDASSGGRLLSSKELLK